MHDLIREIQAIAQTGLHYAQDPYDEERYLRLREIAFEMMAGLSDLPTAEFAKFFLPDSGYATPKVDLRTCVFRDDEVLLVQERSDGRWTLPGGWADQNERPKDGAMREVVEESGYEVEITKLYAVKSRETEAYKHLYPVSVVKLFYLGRVTGGQAIKEENAEVIQARFFSVDQLPPLSEARVLAKDIELGFSHWQRPDLPSYFD